jgi:hypothetical protein
VTATGLSATPAEYRKRLEQQSDAQIDAWAVELMRDVSISHGVRRVLADLRSALGVDDRGLEQIYARGGGPVAAVGHTADGHVMVPAISLYFLVDGSHRMLPDARERLITYLVKNFDELIYI